MEIVVTPESVDGVPHEAEIVFRCSECDRVTFRWWARCPSCGSYNTLEERDKASVPMKPMRLAPPVWKRADEHLPTAALVTSNDGSTHEVKQVSPEETVCLSDLGTEEELLTENRILTGEPSLDFVLNGGMSVPSVVMIGGDPGVGKSTLLTQVYGHVGASGKVLYGCGEESRKSVAIRARRLGIIDKLNERNLLIKQGTDYEALHAEIEKTKPKMVILDSIQAYSSKSAKVAVSISEHFHKTCHKLDIIGWIVCHVTKGGDFAGPNTIDHNVDVNIMLTATDSGQVAATSTKNRFGPTDVAGLFQMRENGLRSVG